MTFDLLREFANTEVFCLFHNCMWQSRHSEVNVYFLELSEQTRWLSTYPPFVWSASTFSSASSSLSTRSKDTGTQLLLNCGPFTSLHVLTLVLSQTNKTSFWSPEWTNQMVAHSRVSPFLMIGFLILVGFVGSLYSLKRLSVRVVLDLLNEFTNTIVISLFHNCMCQSRFEVCETIPKVQCWECLLYRNQGIVYCTCGHLLKESESRKVFTNGDWTLSQSRTTTSRKVDLEVLSTAKRKHRKNISWPTTCGGDVSNRNLKEFTIAHNEIQHMVIRNSKLAGPRRSAHRYGQISTGKRLRSSKDIKEKWYTTLNKSGRNALMKLRSDFWEAFRNMHRLHRESGAERPEPIPLYQYQKWHSSSSSSSTSWRQWNEHWWSS